MAAPTQFAFDRFAPDALESPYELYERAREHAPVFYAADFDLWMVTRYEDVREVLADSERFSSAYLIRTPHMPAPGVAEVLATGHPEVRMLLNQDPPDHTRVRGLVADAFSPRVVRRLEPRIQVLVDELLDAVAGREELDLIAALTLPLPLRVICELLGLPLSDAEQLRAWTDDMALLTSFGATPEQQLSAAHSSVACENYLAAAIEARRADPGDDLISHVLRTPPDGSDPLTTDEAISLLMTLVFAGHETTANLLGNALRLLLSEPSRWAAVAEDPSTVDAAVEETLRIDTSVQGIFRRTVADTPVGGVVIPAGAQVFVLLGSANRDPGAFERPDEFDAAREEGRHLSFGRGIHFCVGAQLARTEARIALTTLARRLPGLRLAPGARPAYPANLLHRGPTTLPALTG